MPDKPLTVLTYAASASLAAIALVYFFHPAYLLDGETGGPGGLGGLGLGGGGGVGGGARRKGAVGLANPMNDCFINSVLQALAGLRDLRLYLVRELHRRRRGDPAIYSALPPLPPPLPSLRSAPPPDARRALSLQGGEVTQGLKDMLDRLNERPLHRKTISAAAFVRVLERAFDTRISRAQQDAQELLQIVAERLCDEYHAAEAARRRARERWKEDAAAERAAARDDGEVIDAEEKDTVLDDACTLAQEQTVAEEVNLADVPADEAGFPLEGRTESRIECQHCHFKPKPSPTPFVILTLSVPQKASTTLDECFDVHFKTELIDDYKCDRCRLEHALALFRTDLARARSEAAAHAARAKIRVVERAIVEDPEQPPAGVTLPDSKLAPARRIERHVAITSFPRVLVLHLSRSMFDRGSAKNLARVAFPEVLTVGGLLDRHRYRLLGVVTHKGTHNSGHYEAFRRQHTYAPASTPYSPTPPVPPPKDDPKDDPKVLRSPSGRPPSSLAAQKPAAASPSAAGEPGLRPDYFEPTASAEAGSGPTTPSSSPTPSSLRSSERPSSASTRPSSTSIPSKRGSLRSPLGSTTTTPTFSPPPSTLSPPPASHAPAPLASKAAATQRTHTTATPATEEGAPARRESSAAQRLVDSVRPRARRRRHGGGGGTGAEAEPPGRWWRISDDKVRECRTADVLAMQKEVYLLFYEMERDGRKGG